MRLKEFELLTVRLQITNSPELPSCRLRVTVTGRDHSVCHTVD
jgi:hypothetical protein